MASEIRVNKINSRTGVGTITLSPTGVDFTGITTVATLKATTGIVTTLSVTGTTTLNGNLDLQDDDKILIGTGDDLQIYHDGSNSYVVEEGTGELRLNSNNAVRIRKHDNETMALFTANGASELYYDNSKKFETTSTGVTITGTATADGLSLGDSEYAYFGASNDLEIYHNGTDSVINDTSRNLLVRASGTGDLWLQSDNQVYFGDIGGNETFIEANDNGDVKLFYDNSQKLATKSDGIVVTGGIYLDGSGGTGSANKLDDYEEGTWTPTINFGGSFTGGTYASNEGFYTKIGRLVNVSCELALSSKGSSTGTVNILGLPFTPNSDDESRASGVVGYHQDVSSIDMPIQILIEPDQTSFPLRDSGSASSVSINNSNLGNGFRFYFTITYMTS